MTENKQPAVQQDPKSWEAGHQAGLDGKASTPPHGVDRLSYYSGLIEGKAKKAQNRKGNFDLIFSDDKSVYPQKLNKIAFFSPKHESLTRQAHALFLKICDSINESPDPKRRTLLEDLRIKALERYERRRDQPTP